MKTIFKTWLGICLSASVLLLGGCGGGGEPVAGVGSGGTGSNRSYVAGLVTKSDGELVVNGVHIETDSAKVSEASEPDQPLAPAAIQPGMMVEVDASSISNSGGKQVAKAERIRIASPITGHLVRVGNALLPGLPTDLPFAIPTSADDAASVPAAALPASAAADNPDAIEADQIIYVLGMKVFVRPETRFDENLPEGFASVKKLNVLDVLEVHGFFDAQNHSIIATRIIKKPKDTKAFSLKGKVINLDAFKKFFQFDGWPVLIENLTKGLEKLLKNGRIVQIKFSPEKLKFEPGSVPLSDLTLDGSVSVNVPQSSEKLDAVVDGLVTHIDDEAGQRISINNVEIDLAGVVVRCDDGITVCPAPKLSDRLRVRGDMVAEKLIAKEVVLLEKLEDLKAPEKPLP